MLAKRKTQCEIAEYYGFKDKAVVHDALKRDSRNAKQIPKARGRKPAKTLQEQKYENGRLKMELELLRFFCNPWKRGEAKGKVRRNLSSPERVLDIRYV